MMSHVRRLPIVAVIGSGAPDHGNPGLSEAIGRQIAEMGFHLLTGGGRGVMADASRGFTSVPDRAGLALGIIPRSAAGDEDKEGYPNPWVELPIHTHLAGRLGPDGEDSRNPINVLTAWRIIALPGSEGTRAEIQLAVRYGKPVLAVTDERREREEAGFLDFLREMRVEHQAVRRVGGGWDLGAVRGFLSEEGLDVGTYNRTMNFAWACGSPGRPMMNESAVFVRAQDIGDVVLKLVGLYLLIMGIVVTPELLAFSSDSSHSANSVSGAVVYGITYLALGICFIRRSANLAKILFGAVAAVGLPVPIATELQTVTFRVMGIWILVKDLPRLVQAVVENTKETLELGSIAGYFGTEVALGVFLLLYRSAWVLRLWKKLRSSRQQAAD